MMVKRKLKGPTKAERLIAQQQEHEQFLRRMGYKGTAPKTSVNEIPDYRTDNFRITSNVIPDNGAKKKSNTYSGNEIAGIVVTHKSNLMPIRKDNPQAAVDAAQMRRN
jgi:hypothetical protein